MSGSNSNYAPRTGWRNPQLPPAGLFISASRQSHTIHIRRKSHNHFYHLQYYFGSTGYRAFIHASNPPINAFAFLNPFSRNVHTILALVASSGQAQ